MANRDLFERMRKLDAKLQWASYRVRNLANSLSSPDVVSI